MSSPDVRTIDTDYKPNKENFARDPFWPPVGFNFPVSPGEMYDWATLIFNASEFYEELDL